MNFDIKDYKDLFRWDVPNDYVPDIPLPEKVLEDVQSRVSYALECLVHPRIKGCITAGKLKWRGIKRKSSLIYKGHCWKIYINNNGSITTTHVGTVVQDKGKNLDLVYPIITQRKNLIDLNFDSIEFSKYDFWITKNHIMSFGSGMRMARGILDQIVKN